MTTTLMCIRLNNLSGFTQGPFLAKSNLKIDSTASDANFSSFAFLPS